MSTPSASSGDGRPPGRESTDRWAELGHILQRRSGVVALLTVIVTVVLGVGITRLEFTTSQDNYLNPDSQIARDNQSYQSLFGGEAMITLFTVDRGDRLRDLFTPRNIAQFNELQKTLDAGGQVESVITPLTALEFTNNLVTSPDGNLLSSPAGKILLGAQTRDPSSASAKLRLADGLKTLARVQAIPVAQRTYTNPTWIDFLLYDNTGAIRKSLRPFFPSTSTAQMITRLRGNASIEDQGKGATIVEKAMRGRTFEHATIMTTGAAVLLRDINDYLRGGFLSLGGISLALMAGLLLIAFAVRWRLLPLGVVAVGLVWAFGLAGYIGIPLSVVTIAGLPVLLGVGIDFAVQLHSRVEEEAQLDRAAHPVIEAVRRLLPALALATVAGVLSFLALEFSAVPMIRDFGTLLAVGLPVIVLATVLLITASLGLRERRTPTRPKDYTHGPLGRTVVALGSLPRVTALPLVVVAIAVFVGGMAVDGHLKIQTDPEKWVNQDSQVIKNINQLRQRTGSASELGVFVQSGDVFSDANARFVADLADTELARHPDDILTASSLVTTISFTMEVPGASIVRPTGQDIRLGYAAAPPDIQRSTVNLDHNAQNIIFRVGSGSLERRAVIVKDVRNSIHPPQGISATPAGLAVVGTGLLDNFKKNRIELTYYALIGVFLILFIRYRNIAKALLSLIPVLIAVGLSSIVAKLAGFDLSPLTALSGPLVIALCTEFTTLLVQRHLEERRRGRTPREAVEQTAARTGRAFMVSALAAVIGILVLGFSSLPLLRDFGLVVALNVAVALLSALVVLPPLLVWTDEHGWVHRTRPPAAGGPPGPAGPAGPAENVAAPGPAETGGHSASAGHAAS